MTPDQRKALTTAIKYLSEPLKTRAVDNNLVLAGSGSHSMYARSKEYQEIAKAVREMQAMLGQGDMQI